MNRRVIVFGASGHGRVVADIVRANGDEVVGFLDDDENKNRLGLINEYENYNTEFVIGIGNAEIREKLSHLNCRWYTAIHPSAVVSPSATIGAGTVIMANAVIDSGAVIGKHCIINSGAIVEHDDIIEEYAHISVGAKLGGSVFIGKDTWIGIGAVVSNNISICNDCIIGAGAVVVKNITEKGIYIGVPARMVDK